MGVSAEASSAPSTAPSIALYASIDLSSNREEFINSCPEYARYGGKIEWPNSQHQDIPMCCKSACPDREEELTLCRFTNEFWATYMECFYDGSTDSPWDHQTGAPCVEDFQTGAPTPLKRKDNKETGLENLLPKFNLSLRASETVQIGYTLCYENHACCRRYNVKYLN